MLVEEPEFESRHLLPLTPPPPHRVIIIIVITLCPPPLPIPPFKSSNKIPSYREKKGMEWESLKCNCLDLKQTISDQKTPEDYLPHGV